MALCTRLPPPTPEFLSSLWPLLQSVGAWLWHSLCRVSQPAHGPIITHVAVGVCLHGESGLRCQAGGRARAPTLMISLCAPYINPPIIGIHHLHPPTVSHAPLSPAVFCYTFLKMKNPSPVSRPTDSVLYVKVTLLSGWGFDAVFDRGRKSTQVHVSGFLILISSFCQFARSSTTTGCKFVKFNFKECLISM